MPATNVSFHSMNRCLKFFILAFILFSVTGLQAQNATFRAFANNTSISKDEFFEITFQIENGKVGDFKAPSFTDFNLLSGPMQSVSTSVINGKASSSRSYTYTLEPLRIGTFTIPGATAIIDGRSMQSNGVTITVTATAENNNRVTGSGDVFVRLEPSATVAFPGEQIALAYKVYTRTDISSFNLDRNPDINGAYVKECKNYNTAVKQVQINGKTYISKVTRRQILYPTQSGTISIQPAVITMGIPDKDEDPFSTLFGTSRPKQVKTNAIEINVKPLPAPIPESFSGAVGQFTYTCSASTTKLTTDEAVKLNFTITGDGDIKRVKNPEFPKDTLFEIYSPQVNGEQETEDAGNWVNSRSYTIDILPRVPGEYTLHIPPFIYFDPDTKNYKTIQPDPIALTVTKGNKTIPDRPLSATETQVASPDFWKKNKVWLLGGIGALFAMAIFMLIRRQKNQSIKSKETEVFTARPQVTEELNLSEKIINPLTEQFNEQSNESITQTGIEKATIALHRNDLAEFYRILNQTLSQRIADKFRIPFSEFSRTRIQNEATSTGMDTHLYKEIDQILAKLEFANYAHYYPQEDAAQVLEQVKIILSKISAFNLT